MLIALIVVVALVVVVGGYWVAKRNSIIASRNRVEESWSGIDVQLKRRHDLVPNLVETVKGYATHERETFAETTEARAEAMAAESVEDTAENYPDLKATQNFQQLSRNLSQLEDEIQASRRIYNSNVQAYNTEIEQFPASIVANQGGFTAREFFEIDDPSQREPVAVDFGG
jgi:LemA protein